MTILYFSGLQLDTGDADENSSNEADYLDRRDARPPVVIRGFDVAGNPIASIRAGQRIDDAVATPANTLTEYGYGPEDTSILWLYPVMDVYGNTVDGYARSIYAGQYYQVPFSFQPVAAIPMPDGHLFCLSAPLARTYQLGVSTQQQYSGYFRDYFRVYRRAGDWIQDFPALHGGPIHDAYWDGSGNCYIAGDEVGDDRYSLRKYDSDYSLQWSLSFKDYWPISTVEVRTATAHFSSGRAQFNQRRASVRIEPAPDGSLYVISEIAVTHGYLSGSIPYYIRRKQFFMIARVSTAGVMAWIRVLECPTTVTGEPDRRRFSCKAISDQLVICLRDGLPFRYSVGESGGDYSWNEYLEAYKTDEQWTYQELYDYFYEDRMDELNGLVIDEDGDFVEHLFPSSAVVVQSVMLSQGVLVETKIYPDSFINCLLCYANSLINIFSKRIRWLGLYEENNVDPQYVRHVFDTDLTLVSDDEIAAFNYTDSIAVTEEESVYWGRRVLKTYGPAYLASLDRTLFCANHFQAFDAAGDPLWVDLVASGWAGVNLYGKPWRDYGLSRTNDPFNSLPAGSTQAQWQAAHDALVYTTAHGATASTDLLTITYGSTNIDFWRAATDISIVYNSPTPSLALPIFLKLPGFAGTAIAYPSSLSLVFALHVPFLRREYVGPLMPSVYRVTLSGVNWPFSGLNVRKTALEITVSAVCPAVSEPALAVALAETDPTFTVWAGVRFQDGTEQLESLLTAPITGIRYDRGSRSWSVTLEGRYAPPETPNRPRTLTKAMQSETRTGLRIWTGPVDPFLNPGNVLHWGADNLVAGTVEYEISPNEARMIVREASTS